MEDKIKSAIEHLTPDVLDKVLSKCGSAEGNVFILPERKRKNNWLRPAASVAAVFLLAFTGLFSYTQIINLRPDALVTLDVNPSILLEVNKNDRVINVNAINEDAEKILDNMDLKDTQINVAINALIGSMLKYGYIRENANSVLLSVESGDEEKEALLQKNLSESISLQLSTVNGAVISQQLEPDSETDHLADEHKISHGKAALIKKIIDKNSHLQFADLARLSVNELNLLVGSKRVEAEGMEAQGRASDTDLIGSDAANRTAFEHAGVTEGEVKKLKNELDYDDGAMVYEVEFKYNGVEYEYEINASTGEIISWESDDDD